MAKSKQRLTPAQARQGSSRRMNLRVLIASLTLALIAGLLFYATLGPHPQPASAPLQQGELR
jgi:hypothetical protein